MRTLKDMLTLSSLATCFVALVIAARLALAALVTPRPVLDLVTLIVIGAFFLAVAGRPMVDCLDRLLSDSPDVGTE